MKEPKDEILEVRDAILKISKQHPQIYIHASLLYREPNHIRSSVNRLEYGRDGGYYYEDFYP